ncbi:MAG: alpha/beta hydrolase, partial [Micrococcales bacterium]|nr:alpha/beta hydrolase [Micrococcales bacterium]
MGAALAIVVAGCGGGQPEAGGATSAAPPQQVSSETSSASGTPVEIVPKRTDIVYADDGMKEHKLDLYMPSASGDAGQAPQAGFPTIVWVHGGGWAGGEKADINNTEIKIDQFRDVLLEHGYAIAAVDYRLVPDGKFPEPMQDVAAAVRYLKKHAAELGLDPNRFVLGGDSAGGHIATMVAMTPDKPELQGTIGVTDEDTKVKAIVDYYAIYDLTKRTEDQKSGPCGRAKPGAESSHGQLIGADPDSPQGEPIAAKASPITYVNSSTPPVILFYGSQDCTTPPPQAERFEAALKAAGVPTEVTKIDASHAAPEFF